MLTSASNWPNGKRPAHISGSEFWKARAPQNRRFDGKDVINLASNNYLGLTTHPKLIEAAIEATRKYGAGSGAVRTISGTMDLHMELERRIAKFKNVESCVVFNPDSLPTQGLWRPC